MSWNVAPPSMLISSTPPSKPSCMLKLFRKVICTGSEPSHKIMLVESSRLSLIVAGSSTNAALSSVSAAGTGTPESDVPHVVLAQPGGSAGGVTVSKLSKRRNTGSHVPSTLTATATVLLDRITKAAAKKQSDLSALRNREAVNVRF